MVNEKQAARRGILWVLAGKYFANVLKSPGLLACCVFPVVFLALFRISVTDSLDSANAAQLLLSVGMLFSTGMVPGTTTVYPMAEAREKRTLRTLSLAGVSRGSMIAAHGMTSIAYTTLAAAGCFLVSGAPLASMAPFMLVTMLASIPLTAFALLLGLASRNQMSANLFSLPIILIGIAPLLCMYAETAFQALPLLPSGGGFALVYALTSQPPFEPSFLPLIAQLAWAVVSVIALVAITPRIPRDDA